MGGYAGKFLLIDLTYESKDSSGSKDPSESKNPSGSIDHFTIDENVLKKFIGGSGLGASIFIDRCTPNVKPLSEENPLIVMTGPLTGTTFPGSSRFSICGKSPLTCIWGEASIGGNFGPELKKAGYDGILLLGASKKPVYLFIDNDRVEIRDASTLWGKDIYETTDLLKESLGSRFKILCIGQAGENLVLYAAIGNDKSHFAGRTGMGAIMGFKMLKAIAVHGSGKVKIENADDYKRILTAVAKGCKESLLAQSLHEMGTDSVMDLEMVTGDVPIKNWTIGQDLKLSESLGGPTLAERYLVRTHTCSFCPIACKRVIRVNESTYLVEEGPGPEYQTCCSFGTMIMNYNLPALVRANELCNRYGMDTISCGSTIAFAIDCFENGLLSTKNTDGLVLKWGDMNVILKLLEKIAFRIGIGDLLAEGTRRAAERIGSDAHDLAVQVKGLEVPNHDPRGFHGMGLAYVYSNRGACHNQHSVLPVEQGWIVRKELDLEEDYKGQTSNGKAKMVIICENYGMLLNALCQCHFVNFVTSPAQLLNAFNAITGWKYTLDDLLACGERIWFLKRGLINLMGITDKHDILPKRILTPLKNGCAAGSIPDIELMKSEYKGIRRLNERGIPVKEKLMELGLDILAKKLYT